ncbi:LysR family transcriptional regulator [Corallococcus sp. CA053C]|uniref:LysR family transcriptional regulator n=1 Tax=Corallococcus sp. CA053C TaxID=2316732 RepID=UPI0013156370|nr:LysR family transcriptional regulator [Corallococcus sp. CA053C]
MESLSAIGVFARVAETGSFASAARALGITPSAASKSVARLEERLGTRLFQRTTRRMHLTEQGARFHERCVRALTELRDAESELAHASRTPQGRLRVSVPEMLALRLIIPHLQRFRRAHPHLELDLDVNDHVADIVGDGLDAAVRCGELSDSGLMRRRLGPKRFVLCASPAYLQAHGTPRSLEALRDHDCIRYRFVSTGRVESWALRQPPGAPTPRIPETFVFNNSEAVTHAARAGFGIAQFVEIMIRPELEAGTLRPILREHSLERGALWLVWPHARRTPPKVKALGDFLARLVEEDEAGAR